MKWTKSGPLSGAGLRRREGALRHLAGGVRCAIFDGDGWASPGVVWVSCRRHLVPLSPSFRSDVAVISCPCHRHFAPLSPSYGAPRGGCAARIGRLGRCVKTTLTHFDHFRPSFGSLVAVIWSPFRRNLGPLSPSFRALSAVISCPCRRHIGPLSPSFRPRDSVASAPPTIKNGAAHLTAKWRSAPSPAGRPVPESGPLLVQHKI
jgi:hypothetical protein